MLGFTSNGQPVDPATGVGVRYPVSGEVGPRNNYRGDGYFGIDSALRTERMAKAKEPVSVKTTQVLSW